MVLAQTYARGREQALAETGLAGDTIPAECAYMLEQLLENEID
jgi:hypothetical protein